MFTAAYGYIHEKIEKERESVWNKAAVLSKVTKSLYKAWNLQIQTNKQAIFNNRTLYKQKQKGKTRRKKVEKKNIKNNSKNSPHVNNKHVLDCNHILYEYTVNSWVIETVRATQRHGGKRFKVKQEINITGHSVYVNEIQDKTTDMEMSLKQKWLKTLKKREWRAMIKLRENSVLL